MLRSFESAAALDPQWAQPLVHLAIAHMDAGRTEQAISFMARALELAPGDADIAFRLGQYHERAGHASKAEAMYRAALQIDAEHKISRKALERMVKNRS